MPTIATRDGTRIFYKDWGAGPPVVFSHGWPLNADMWDQQLLFLAQRGFRAIAHDRRGHGRSDQPSEGNNMETYAQDLADLLDALDLKGVTLVGHSTGGGEVTRCAAQKAAPGRVAKLVLVDAIPPFLLKTDDNPEGIPIEVFDQIRAGMTADLSQYWKDVAYPFYGANRPGAKVSEGVREQFWRLSIQAGLKGAYECVAAFSESDFRDDLAKLDIPVLVIHGDDDQIVPIAIGGLKTVKLVKDAVLKVYPGAPHGLPTTHADQLNADILDFLRPSSAFHEAEAAAGAEAV